MWRIGWVAHQIVADPRHLFDANTFYPETRTLTYSDSMLLPALVSAPLLWMGVPLAVAYTLLLLSTFVLSGIATYMLARALSLSPGASWIAALLFAFCQYRFEHYSHLELQMTQWMPLTLLAALRLLSTGAPRYFVYLALAAAAQWYSSMYYGVFLTIYAGVFVLVLAAVWRPGWTRLIAASTALACGLALALPLARIYQSTEGDRGIRDTHAVAHYSAEPVNYLHPHSRSPYRDWRVGKKVSERELFPHFTPIVLAAAGAWPPIGATRLALLVSGLVAFDGSLGFNGSWYEFAYNNVAPLRSMRVPARFAVLVNLTLALLGGFGASRLDRSRFLSQTAARVLGAAHRCVSRRVGSEPEAVHRVEAAAASLLVARAGQRRSSLRVPDGPREFPELCIPVFLDVALDQRPSTATAAFFLAPTATSRCRPRTSH